MTEKEVARTGFFINPMYFENNEPPISFGYSAEHKDWLDKERTEEEIEKFIRERPELSLFINTAMYNNDIGFSSTPLFGEYFISNNDLYLKVKGNETEPLLIAENYSSKSENFDNISTYIYKSKQNSTDETDFVAILFQDGTEEEINGAMQMIFLKEAEVNTYRKLGKVLNRGERLFRKWCDNNQSPN